MKHMNVKRAVMVVVAVAGLAGGAVPLVAHHAFNAEFDAKKPVSFSFRRGFTKASLMPGTKIKVDGYQAKDGTHRANGRDLTFADGKKLFMGSSGTGAPYELARPGVDTERK
jgi:hypothetical protein